MENNNEVYEKICSINLHELLELIDEIANTNLYDDQILEIFKPDLSESIKDVFQREEIYRDSDASELREKLFNDMIINERNVDKYKELSQQHKDFLKKQAKHIKNIKLIKRKYKNIKSGKVSKEPPILPYSYRKNIDLSNNDPINSNPVVNEVISEELKISIRTQDSKSASSNPISNKVTDISNASVYCGEKHLYETRYAEIKNMISQNFKDFTVLTFTKRDYHAIAVLFMTFAGDNIKRTTQIFKPETTFMINDIETREWCNPSTEHSLTIVVTATLTNIFKSIKSVLPENSDKTKNIKHLNVLIDMLSTNISKKIIENVIRFTYDPNFKDPNVVDKEITNGNKISSGLESDESVSISISKDSKNKTDNYKEILRDYISKFCIIDSNVKIARKVLHDEIASFVYRSNYKSKKYLNTIGPKRVRVFLKDEFDIDVIPERSNVEWYHGISLHQKLPKKTYSYTVKSI